MGLRVMTLENAILAGGVLGLSCIVAYALWLQVRVIRLREDLFEIRDDLFDFAATRGECDDPGYRYARGVINAVIAMADSISLGMFVHLNKTQFKPTHEGNPACLSVEMQDEVNRAIFRCGSRIARYILHETLSGRCTYIACLIAQMNVEALNPEQRVTDCIKDRIPSDFPRDLCVG